MADEIPEDKQRDNEYGDGEKAAAKPGLAISGKPPAGGSQVAVRGMSTAGMPAHDGTQDQDD
jgi:hypothetical protein